MTIPPASPGRAQGPIRFSSVQWKDPDMQQIIRRVRRAVLVLAVAAPASAPAVAAPFCIQNQVIAPQCIYYDAQQCQRDAAKQNAECAANPSELHLTRGNGQYCVVTSGQVALCNFTDLGVCTREANQQNGACVPSPQRVSIGSPDPYSTTQGQ